MSRVSSHREAGRRPACRSVIRSEVMWGYACVCPAVALLCLFAAVPIVQAVWLSFHQRLPIFGIDEFIGLRNYGDLLSDQRFWSAFGTTLYFTGVSVAVELVLGLVIALLLTGSDGPGPAAYGVAWGRVVMLVPWAIPTVVSARMWEWLYHPEYGLLNYLLKAAHVVDGPIYWLGSPVLAIHGAIIMDVWKTTPFAALLLLAGLQAIPRDLYRAATVDGASAWSTFRHITLPLLWPVILVVLAFRTMDAFRVFDAVYVLTGGGPGNSTETLSIYAYKTLFQSLQFGYGSAATTMVFGLVALITAGYFLLLRRGLRVAS